MCIRVGLCQTKNGLPSLLALSMKSNVLFRNTSSTVSMSYFVRSCPCPGAAAGGHRPGSSACRFCPTGASRSRRPCSWPSSAARCADHTSPSRILRIRWPVGVRQGVEVVQVAVKLVESVQGRQVLVQVSHVVLAELAGCVALSLECRGEGTRLGGHAHVGPSLTDGCQSSAQRNLARDEAGSARRAARFSIVVGEPHPLAGELVDVGRLARHHALMVRR